MKMNLKNMIFFAAILVGTLAGCQKEGKGDTPVAGDTAPFAMVYEDFITPDDITIDSADTTMISVSRAYADKIGVNDFEGRVVTIWRTIGTTPFIRYINDVKKKSDKYVLTTRKAEAAEMFEELDLTFDTDLYIDHDVPTKATRGSSDYEVDDVSEKYTDEEGVVHPAVIIFEEPGQLSKSLATRAGGEERTYYTAEELLANNFEFNLINIKELAVSLEKTLKTDKDSLFSINVSGKAEASARLTLFGKLKVGAFSLKEFQFGLRGSADLKAMIGLDFKAKVEEEYKHSLVQVGKTTLVFWAGPIPIPITVEPNLVYKSTLAAEAKLSLYASAMVGGEFQAGMEYKSSRKGDKWKNISGGKSYKSVALNGIFPADSVSTDSGFGVEISAGAEATFGTYWETGMYLAGSAGPKFSTGPKIGVEGEVSGKLDPIYGNLSASVDAGAYIAWAGDFGVKFKVLGYTIGEATYKYELLRFDFAKYSGEFNYNIRTGKTEFEEGWSALLLDNEEWAERLEDNASENPGGMVPPSLPTDN